MSSFRAFACWSVFLFVGIPLQAQSGEPECSLVRPRVLARRSVRRFDRQDRTAACCGGTRASIEPEACPTAQTLVSGCGPMRRGLPKVQWEHERARIRPISRLWLCTVGRGRRSGDNELPYELQLSPKGMCYTNRRRSWRLGLAKQPISIFVRSEYRQQRVPQSNFSGPYS
jgi:hypothetical protein